MHPRLTTLPFKPGDRVQVTNWAAPFPSGSTGTVTDPANGLREFTVMVRLDRDGHEYPFKPTELEVIADERSNT